MNISLQITAFEKGGENGSKDWHIVSSDSNL